MDAVFVMHTDRDACCRDCEQVYYITAETNPNPWLYSRTLNGDRVLAISTEILQLAQGLLAAVDIPRIVALHLPEPASADEYRDEFGFVFLADGTAAPFYVSLPGILETLRAQFPSPQGVELDMSTTIAGFGGTVLAGRALALGAWNALGQHLLRRAGFRFPPRGNDGEAARPGERVGMVGYFRPVIDRLVERNLTVVVVEQQPERVPPRDGVVLCTDLAALNECPRVYCTASTLINDTLDEVLHHCRPGARFDLIGPSGSGLPDVLFEHGVHAVGGVSFGDSDELRASLDQGRSWGKLGNKYELTRQNYPGIDALLAAVCARSPKLPPGRPPSP